MVKTASLYDNFCKTENDVIDDVIIWVQDGNCKKMARENFSIGALYNITIFIFSDLHAAHFRPAF